MRRAARGRLAAAWLCALAAAGCDSDAATEERLLTLEREVGEGVTQYVSLLCECFGVAEDEAQARCRAERAVHFPTSACDQEMVRLDEVEGEAFLSCLQFDINRGSACLIGCDASLIRQCQEAFLSVDTLTCQSLLTDRQREVLRECGRQREASRSTP